MSSAVVRAILNKPANVVSVAPAIDMLCNSHSESLTRVTLLPAPETQQAVSPAGGVVCGSVGAVGRPGRSVDCLTTAFAFLL
jgi:hypothetical protein